MSAQERVAVAFASGTVDLIPAMLERMEEIAAGLTLYVVTEFRPDRGRWIPYYPRRTFEQNRARIADALRGKEIVYSALLLQPRQPYWSLRLQALLVSAGRFLLFNENLDHFPLHPRASRAILTHLLWRLKNLWFWETRPGGWSYTLFWRLRHPSAYRRPLLHWLGLRAGKRAADLKRTLAPDPPPPGTPRPPGVSVVIPSRDGRELLDRLFQTLLPQVTGPACEVIVVDNGSSDGTREWLESAHPGVAVESSRDPLSFASAVNRGVALTRFSHVLLLNNDMVLEHGFVHALQGAFGRVPGLFCATAQIFFPPGKRREETGKAVLREECGPDEFPVTCLTPVDGEDLSYVTYGSGGCSMYDTARFLECGGMGEVFTPAYVEDLDLGWRGWSRGWPTVFVAGARAVHHHRSTTRRFFTDAQIQEAVEANFLRFLGRSVGDPELFLRLWRRALWRLNVIATYDVKPPWIWRVLRTASKVNQWPEAPGPEWRREKHALALGGGDVACFPGREAVAGRPTVLIASPYPPFPMSHGGAVRMFNLIRHAAREFNIVLLVFCGEHSAPAREILELCVEVVEVRRRGSHLRPLTARPDVVEEHESTAFHAALREMIRKHSPSLVQLEFTQMALYAEDCEPLPTLLVEHDVTIDLYAQLHAQRGDWETAEQLKRWRTFETKAWGDVSCVVTMSGRDAKMIEGSQRTVVLPNGVDPDWFRPSRQEHEPKRILFIGSFAHLPNLMALRFFMEESWPALRRAGARLHVIAGADPEYWLNLYKDRISIDPSGPDIELEAFVADVRPAYARASVVIAPLLASAGTNIKILEAMAMGKAIVSTAAAVHGLDIEPDSDVVIATTGEEIVREVQALFEDPDRRQRLERRARNTAERRFDWQVIGRRQAELYRSMIG